MLNSLTKEAFSTVYSKGKKQNYRFFTLITYGNGGEGFRYGICFKKKTNPSRRNKVKRRIRSIISGKTGEMKDNISLVFSLSPDVFDAKFAELQVSVEKALKENIPA